MPPPSTPLSPPPSDAVSRVTFNNPSTHLAVANWAGTLSLYKSSIATHVTETTHPYPLLDATWTSSTNLTFASLSGDVCTTSITPTGLSGIQLIGKHDSAARCVVKVSSGVVSGGWDKTVRVWDERVEPGRGVSTADAGGKVYAMCAAGANQVAYATNVRKVRLVDVRRMDAVVYERQPPTLSYQLRGLNVSRDATKYIVGSTEGRVAVETFDGGDGFSFKCHRMDGLAFPVNCIEVNGKYGSFATGGGDGYVGFWDGEARKRIAQWGKWPTSVSSLAFDAQSDNIAVAVSYTFEEGEKDCPGDQVYLIPVDDSCIVTKKAREEPDTRKEQGK